LNIIYPFLGGVIFVITAFSALKTLVVPSANLSKIVVWVDKLISWVYLPITKFVKNFEKRDRILATQAAVYLFVVLVVWVLLIFLSLALLLEPSVPGFGNDLREAGSSLFTLGFASTNSPWATAIDFIGSFSGLIIVALQIAYLPTLYNSYNRRETEVTLMTPRSGEPPWGPEILARSKIGLTRNDLPEMYGDWEKWAADVTETHTSYPSLLRFRSPHPHASWLISFLAVLDSAALYLAVDPDNAPIQARLCLRMGFTCLRRIADMQNIAYNPDPLPTDGIQLSYQEFLDGLQRMSSVGFPINRTPQDAWQQFAGWRVNYESIAYQLALELDVVPAQWGGPRRSRILTIQTERVVNRTPEQPFGESPPLD
jgi:hypothetical protein